MTVVRGRPATPAMRAAQRRERRATKPRGSGTTGVLVAETVILAVTVALLYGGLGSEYSSYTGSELFRLAWLNNVVFVLQLLVLRRVYTSAFSPVSLYTIFLWLFSSGQLVLYSFGSDPEGADVLNRSLLTSVSAAASFVVLGFSAFSAGAVFFGVFLARSNRRPQRTFARAEWQNALRTVGWFCVVVGIAPFAIDQLYNLRVVLTSGYSAYYDAGSRLNSSVLSLSYLLITGVIFLGLSGRTGYARRAFLTIAAIALLRLVAGDRGEGLIYLAAAVVLWNCTNAKRSWRLPTLFGVFAVAVIPAIGTLRHTFASSGIAGASTAFEASTALEDTLRTTGATLFPLVKTMELVPATTPHTDGLTYVSSLLGIIPSKLQPSVFFPLTREPIYAKPASWLQSDVRLSYGPGFTPFAEAYLNLGWWPGVLAMAVLGCLVGIALRIPSRGLNTWPVRTALVLATFALLGFSVRGSFNYVVPFLTWYVLTPAAAVYLVAYRLHRRNGPS